MEGEGWEVSYWLYYSIASLDPKIGLAESGLDTKMNVLTEFRLNSLYYVFKRF